MKIFWKKGITVKDALILVLFAGIAGHLSLWLINQSANAFYESSVYKLTGKTVEEKELSNRLPE